MQEFTTPMMKQYMAIKKQYMDCLLLYRMGDFYELFLEDAKIGSQVLNITLTGKSAGKDTRIPMAGVPYHAIDTYLAKLVKAGYKVAICEQVSLPNKYGLVDREVVRIVTPGTMLDEKALEKKENNYIVSMTIKDSLLAICCADISTGYFAVYESVFTDLKQSLQNQFSRINPSECILSEVLYNDPELLKILKGEKNLNISCFSEWETYSDHAAQFLKQHFGVATLASFGIEYKLLSLQAAAALLGYLQTTQKAKVTHIKKIILSPEETNVILDRSTMINLELFSTIRDHEAHGSFLQVIDQTVTAMGGRLLKRWILKPLLDKNEITQRHETIEVLQEQYDLWVMLQEALKGITDIERILSRLSVNIGNPRDVINLKISLQMILTVKEIFKNNKMFRESVSVNDSQTYASKFSTSPYPLLKERKKNGNFLSPGERMKGEGENLKRPFTLLKTLYNNISPEIEKVIDIIETSMVDEPPIEVKQGGIIREHIDTRLDALRATISNSKAWMTAFEKKEKEQTGISSLKVRFNKVFGFYIEISNASAHLAPKAYMRKQTLINGERFITPELKHHEEIILRAEEEINQMEYQLFLDVLQRVLAYIEHMQDAAQSIATIDCLVNFVFIAEKNNYIRPQLLDNGEIHIQEGRHPVVEKLLENDMQFVPNSIDLDNTHQTLLVITGPNMAGKSVLIRQVALIVLMNQIGCFVPAQKAELSIVDRIFVRSGAADVITSGLSTFMVEMVETAHILHYATKNSLIIMDEIGRGTSTYDGISIAWAVAQYLVTYWDSPARHASRAYEGVAGGPKTLFATHYHELQELEKEYPKKIKNYHMEVANENGEPIFLHTFLPGSASHSFGIAVAKLAGIPHPVIKKAQEILQTLEKRPVDAIEDNPVYEINSTNFIDHIIHKELDNIHIHQMTPLEALNTLADLKDKIKLYQQNEQVLKID